MGYSVDIEKINEYLHVTARGDKSLANILSYLERKYMMRAYTIAVPTC